MLWTAFLWGLGVSCGSAFGLLLLYFMLQIAEIVTGREKKRDKGEVYLSQSLFELQQRNQLTKETNAKLDRAVEALDNMAELQLRHHTEGR